ncbi:hypothetical protein EB796_022178 [Bugula neritina]|uniref:Uncharacterized protein n=1 Tax=Bugula neritina TaxID=10212 RepID=A0A7J7J119_BUGNE|nr:hypothetical protein EB796_022178 [Bugula neritina]
MGPPRVQNPNFIASPHSSQYNSPYFTSGSDTSGTPQNQFRGSTPNRMGPPRVQNPNFVASPHSSQYSSPYQDRPRPSYFSSPGTPQYTPSPRYTPSPVRARGRATPNTSYSQSPGNSSWRQQDQRLPAQSYFKRDMLKDPWEGLEPYLM